MLQIWHLIIGFGGSDAKVRNAKQKHIEISWLLREKGRDLTQSYDKIPYSNRKIQ